MRKVKSETTRARPMVNSREAKISMLVQTGLSNAAIWSAMEKEYPAIIKDDKERKVVAGKVISFDKEERGKVSRAINSVRGLAIKEDESVIELMNIVGGNEAQAKLINDVPLENRHRFSWGISALDYIYGEQRFVHLTDHSDSKYDTVRRTIKQRDEDGKVIEVEKEVQVWKSGSWQKGDPMIPQSVGYRPTRSAEGHLLPYQASEQYVEHGCPEGYMSIWGGEPGVGKSRTAVKVAKTVTQTTKEPVLYLNGEANESEFRGWVGSDFDPHLFYVVSSQLMTVDMLSEMAFKIRPRLIIIDSVQMLAEWRKGNNGQKNALRFLQWLKDKPEAGKPHILCISQLNKKGDLQGSRALEHLADVVINVTKSLTRKDVFLLECPRKNRGGPTPRGALFKHVNNSIECVSTGDLRTAPYNLVQRNGPSTVVVDDRAR